MKLKPGKNRLISLEIFGDRYPWEGADFSSGDNAAELRRMKRALKAVMEHELTLCQREIVDDFYFHEMSVSEIAGKRGVNKSTVSRHLQRARKKIKRCLQYGFFPSRGE